MVDIILGIVGMLLYPLFSIVFILLDTLQMLFYSLAGIGELFYGNTIFDWTPIVDTNGGNATDTGLIYFLMHSDIVKNMFLSILVLAIFLMIIFTVMAFLKNAYSAKPKSWKEIIGNALKGIMNFVFVPVCCFLGVWVGNIILNAVNAATSQGGSTLMSRKLFIAAAYNANHYRNGLEEGKWLLELSWETAEWQLAVGNALASEGNILPFEKSAITDNLSQDEMANMLDQLYGCGALSIYEWVTVGQGYSLYQINYLTLIVGGVFMMYVMITLAYAMVRRMFIILMLFIISPAMCAMYPLDEGKALGQWRGDFLKQVISAYGAVAGMNLFFSLLPIVSNIRFSAGGTGWAGVISSILNRVFPIDTIIQLLIMICGLFVVKEFISMISGYIGAEDAYSKGASLRKQTTDSVKKYGKAGIRKASKYARGAFDAAKNSKGSKNQAFVTSLMGQGFKDVSKGLGMDLDEFKGVTDFKDFVQAVGRTKLGEDFAGGVEDFKKEKKKKENLEKFEQEQVEYSKILANKNAGFTAYQHDDGTIEDIDTALAKSGRKLQHYADKAGIGDRGIEDVIKKQKLGISVEQFKENNEKMKNLETAQKTAKLAKQDAEDNAVTVTSSPEFAQMASDLVMSTSELKKLFESGVKLNLDERDKDGKKVYDTPDVIAAATKFNREVEKQQSLNDRADERDLAFRDTARNTELTLKDGQVVKLDESTIKSLQLDPNAKGGDGLQAFRDVTTVLDKQAKEQLATLKNVEKAINEANAKKKNEEKK